MVSGEEYVIRKRIRQMLETGEIPCDEPDKIWAGRGTGSHCAACGEAIAPTEVEYEVDLPPGRGSTLRLHRACHDIWRQECDRQHPHATAPR